MKKDFLSIRILHGALCLGALLFFMVVYFLLGTENTGAPEGEDFKVFTYLVPLMVLSSILLSRLLDRNKLTAFKGTSDLFEKLNDYRTRVIMRSALIEGTILFAVVALLLTEDKLNVLYFGIGWLALLSVRPYLAEFSKDYKLSVKEEQEMQQD